MNGGNISSTIKSQETSETSTSLPSNASGAATGAPEAEVHKTVLWLTNEMRSLQEKVKILEDKQTGPDIKINKMIGSINRLSNLAFALLIIMPILIVAIVALVFWFSNSNTKFPEIALWVVSAIGLGALADVIFLPQKVGKIEKELEKLKNK